MTGSHVLSALVSKRAEIAGMIARTQQQPTAAVQEKGLGVLRHGGADVDAKSLISLIGVTAP